MDLEQIDPGLLPLHLLPGPRGRGGQQGLRPPPPGHAGRQQGGHRDVGDEEQGVSGRHPSRRRGAEARDHVLRRRDQVTDQGLSRSAGRRRGDRSGAADGRASSSSRWRATGIRRSTRTPIACSSKPSSRPSVRAMRSSPGPKSEPASTKVVDLMQVLSASVDSVKAAGAAGQGRPPPGRREEGRRPGDEEAGRPQAADSHQVDGQGDRQDGQGEGARPSEGFVARQLRPAGPRSARGCRRPLPARWAPACPTGHRCTIPAPGPDASGRRTWRGGSGRPGGGRRRPPPPARAGGAPS